MVGLCRLCASLRKLDVLFTIKDESSVLCEKLNKCCGVRIKMSDSLPKSICRECLENLHNSYKFYKKVKEAQETLHTLYPSSCCRADNKIESLGSSSLLVEQQSLINQNTPKRNVVGSLLFRTNETESHQDFSQKDSSGDVGLMSSYERPHTVKLNIENSTSSEIETYLHDKHISEHKKKKIRKHHSLSASSPSNVMTQLNKDDLQSDEVIRHINDVITESNLEVEVEVEYVDCFDDDDKLTSDIEKISNDDKQDKHIVVLSADMKLNSWRDYKYMCFICEKISDSFIGLKSHIFEEHNIVELNSFQYKCYDCKKIIPRYTFFLNHVRSTHHRELQLKCDACDLSCKNFEELSYHRTLDCAEAKKYTEVVPCSQCFKSFYNSFGLQNHFKLQHVPMQHKEKYNCTQCGKEFQYKSCLKSHQRLHTDIKKIFCNYCDKSFHNKLSLEQHLYVHVNEKAFQCNICLKSYKTYQILVEHQKRHTDEKRFNCQFCDKRFSQKIQKLAHERCHTGEMPYSCKLCDKRFRYRSAQNAHIKCHTGHKPYSCEYCPKTFADGSNRNKHVKRMHSNGERQENM